jgi:microcystin-dependent protein
MKCNAGSCYTGRLFSLILFVVSFLSVVALRAADLDGNLSVTGNIGVGTTNPLVKVHVENGSVYVQGEGTNDATYSLLLRNQNTDNMLVVYDDGKTYLKGNVGIGTEMPAYKLDVAGSINGSAITINGTPVATSRDTYWSTAGGGAIQYSGGNVGVGTANPSEALDVAGNVRVSGLIYGDGSALTNLNLGSVAALDSEKLNGQPGSYYQNAGNLTGTVATVRLASNLQTLAVNNGASLTNLNASVLASGTVPSARLSGTYNITSTNANALNGQSGSYYLNAANLTGTVATARLVANLQTLAVNNGVSVTNLSASSLASGTIPTARLGGTYNITSTNATSLSGQPGSYYQNAGNLTGTVATARLVANLQTLAVNNGSGLTDLNASSLASGTIPAARLSGTYNMTATNATALGAVTATDYARTDIVETFATNVIVNGRVGIGDSTPSYAVDVAGDVNVTGSFLVNGSVVAATPAGAVMQFAGTNAPSGYLLCQGQAVSRTTYAALFAVVSTTYGVGNGSSTFNVPNLVGRIPVGYDSTQAEFNAMGETGGAKTHTLTTNEMPRHAHTELYETADQASCINGSGYYTRGNATTMTGSTGGGAAHNNLQPYIVLNYIIKY